MPLRRGSTQAAKQANFHQLYADLRSKGHIGKSKRPKNKAAARKQVVAIVLNTARRSR